MKDMSFLQDQVDEKQQGSEQVQIQKANMCVDDISDISSAIQRTENENEDQTLANALQDACSLESDGTK